MCGSQGTEFNHLNRLHSIIYGMVNQQINLTSGVCWCCRALQKLIDNDDNQANWEFSKNTSTNTHDYGLLSTHTVFHRNFNRIVFLYYFDLRWIQLHKCLRTRHHSYFYGKGTLLSFIIFWEEIERLSACNNIEELFASMHNICFLFFYWTYKNSNFFVAEVNTKLSDRKEPLCIDKNSKFCL